jgi:hypothetical protein
VAQTKRKRRTKHRGNAAGIVEQRGRTGRKPTAEEQKKAARDKTRQARLDRPPSWRAAINRGAITAGVFLVIMLLLAGPKQAFPLALFALVFYIPMGYYTDVFVYKRRQRKKAAAGK